MDFDVVVIGGGPGGYVCAIRAAQLGLKAAIVERDRLGGTCLNMGCIPTKAMLQTAKVKHYVDHASEFGIDCEFSGVRLDAIVQRSLGIVSGLNSGVAGLVEKNGISVINGTAKLKDRNTVAVEANGASSDVSAQNIVIATGASPRILPGIDSSLMERGLVWTSQEAVFPKSIPHTVLIIGSGAIGVELASFYNAFGSDVTIAEIQDRILIQEDSEIASFAHKAFVKHGIKIKVGTQVGDVVEYHGRVMVGFSRAPSNHPESESLQSGAEPSSHAENGVFDVVILAIGVVPNTSNLNLNEIGVDTFPNGIIKVSDHMETTVKGIYAIGDVVSPPWLAHKASREGIIAAESIAKKPTGHLNLETIPSCTYSNPQIASIGLTESKANAAGMKVKIGRSSFRGNGKALATGEPGGFVKVIFGERYGELLGAHMIGYEVTELLPVFSLAISAELTGAELMAAIFPHPTMSECLQEAVYDAFGLAIHG
ncbi:MAG: dihydrolipoyl dehydrogenase [Holosporales bacterium]|jgi:dihydrolipoamide dehydrogenase|nr:dihydrolipoyl dehydrogenase [Holosporales bacterium]